MKKYLIVGDPHATPNSIEEMNKLVDFTIKTYKENKCDKLVLLGDQYHTHAILHLTVISFWQNAFKKMLNNGLSIISLVGNHDLAGVYNSMTIHENIMNLTIVSKPMILDGILFAPYFADKDNFIKSCNEFGFQPLLICHQSFLGTKFENGYYDPNGIDSNLLFAGKILSGHIHSQQEFGKVWFPGTARWLTVSDANIQKGIWVVDIDNNTKIVNRTQIDTSMVCIPIFAVNDTLDQPFEPNELHKNAKVTVDITGPADFVTKRCSHFSAMGFKVRAFPEKQFSSEIKESDGIKVALTKFTQSYTPKLGTDNNLLLNLLKQRISWMTE